MDSMWIIKNGIPFTVDSFGIYEKIKNVNLSDKENSIFEAIATAIADGKEAKEAVFSNTTTMMEKAVMLQAKVSEVSDKAVDLCVDNAQPLNIRNLMYWQKQIDANIDLASENAQSFHTEEKAKAHITLEEVRLQMSVEANYRLLKTGYQIDVADLTELVSQLRNANTERAQILFGAGDEAVLSSKQALYNEAVAYDTKQMSDLIDLLVTTCTDYGIETATPDILEKYKEEWKP